MNADASTALPTLAYILAPSYSGSTLLTFLLARHPRIATIGELKATELGDIDRYRCSCGDLLLECRFWRDVIAGCERRGLDLDLHHIDTSIESRSAFRNKLFRASVRSPVFEFVRRCAISVYPGARAELDGLIRRNQILAEAITDLQRGDVFLDGSKDAPRLLHFLRSGRWNIKVIYLQRDGRGVTSSYMRHYGVQYTDAIAAWKRTVKELQTMRSRLTADQVIDISYESLCESPEAVLQEVWEFLGVGHAGMSGQLLDLECAHIMGNQMRLRSTDDITLDESWRRKLSAEQLRIFEREAGKTNLALGYAASGT